MRTRLINVGVVGLGHWGPNLVRNLAGLPDVRISFLCDLDIRRAEAVRIRYCPMAKITTDYRTLCADPEINTVVVATPLRSHFWIGRSVLTAGKHLFIEKPLASSVEECHQLIDCAWKYNRVLMVGHVFEHNPAVLKIKQILDQGELGKLLYVYSQRVNLGRIQNDVNALWSFAPHDISIMNLWLGEEPIRISARGFSFLSPGIEDVVFVTLEYPGGVGVHLHLGWLDPRKVRLMTLVGNKKMLVYDDVSLDQKIQIYDKGVVPSNHLLEAPETFAEFQFQIRVGDVTVPKLQFREPLQIECSYFIDCIQTGQAPSTGGLNGLRVVKALEAAEQSLRQKGKPVEITASRDEMRIARQAG